MTCDEIKAKFSIEDEMRRRQGVEFRRNGREITCPCPFHEDSTPSFRINPEKRVWICDPCNDGGSIIDLVMKLDGLSEGDAIRKLGGERAKEDRQAGVPHGGHSGQKDARATKPDPKPAEKLKQVCSYDYTDERGALIFKVCRYEPKTFRQCHKVGDKWVWSMEGVRRVLYNLPAVIAADYVWIVEGEKDANTLNAIKQTATTNVGGAEKWMDSYTESLKGKHVIICGDTDEKGKKHVALVMEKISSAVATARVINLPQEFKDVSAYSESFAAQTGFSDAIVKLAEEAEQLVKGRRVPVKSMAEIELDYIKFAKRRDAMLLDLGAWLPSLKRIRPLIGGELVSILGDTGIGKTMILQNLALHTRLTTLMFEVELPNLLTFERFVSMATKTGGKHVASTYRHTDDGMPWKKTGKMDHIHVCEESGISPENIEEIINLAGLKIGKKPELVLVDYAQLIKGKGKTRYERASDVAEEMKIIAKRTGSIIVMASQIARKSGDDGSEIYLHDGKDSGSIENSSGLVLGAWRDGADKGRLWLKILKNTKGFAGEIIACRILEDSLLIVEEETHP